MKIYYYQTSDCYCMISHALMLGLHQLGHEVQSNIDNYPFLKPAVKWDLKVVSTNGNMPALYQDCDVFVDGRDQEDVLTDFQYNKYFKSNGDFGIKLPTCVNPQIYYSPNTPRTRKVSFLSGHTTFGREDVNKWVTAEFIDDTPLPVVDRYAGISCNMYSPKYYQVLADSKISINAPGGGTNTKKFFEIMAAGCLTLNYIPRDYPRNPDILKLIPSEIDFPFDAVLNFSSKEELDEILKDPPYELAWKTYEFAKRWSPINLAEYFLNKVGA